MFQYLIGNKDWSLVRAEYDETCCHNVDLIRAGDVLLPIPYDFDLAALTRASYPSSGLNLSTRREYVGYCRTPSAALADAVDHVHGLKAEIAALTQHVPVLSERARERRAKFSAGYFEEADDGNRLLEKFARRCIGRR